MYTTCTLTWIWNRHSDTAENLHGDQDATRRFKHPDWCVVLQQFLHGSSTQRMAQPPRVEWKPLNWSKDGSPESRDPQLQRRQRLCGHTSVWCQNPVHQCTVTRVCTVSVACVAIQNNTIHTNAHTWKQNDTQHPPFHRSRDLPLRTRFRGRHSSAGAPPWSSSPAPAPCVPPPCAPPLDPPSLDPAGPSPSPQNILRGGGDGLFARCFVHVPGVQTRSNRYPVFWPSLFPGHQPFLRKDLVAV
jgi:hypothetical protein